MIRRDQNSLAQVSDFQTSISIISIGLSLQLLLLFHPALFSALKLVALSYELSGPLPLLLAAEQTPTTL